MIEPILPLLREKWKLPESLLSLAVAVEKAIEGQEDAAAAMSRKNFLKVLEAFQTLEVQQAHLLPTSGYGYHDFGREKLEALFARIFHAEDALVRSQLITGTHAIRCALFGILRPGDEVLVIPKIPYDTLGPIFGFTQASGSLREWNIAVRTTSPEDFLSGTTKLKKETKALFLQRSKGYAWQESISIEKLAALIHYAKRTDPGISILVDNCYGEFVEDKEPSDVGADLVVGSLLKNPGGGVAETGGYIVGKKTAVEQASSALTAPGLAKQVGPTTGLIGNFFLGIFLAPGFVGEALAVATFASKLFEEMGYPVNPRPKDPRTDIIQGIQLGNPDKLLAFARGLQKAGPLHANAIPEPAGMAGYREPVVMAGGTFIQGASLELSCDAPLRSPYSVYLQGGLSAVHGKLGVLLAAAEVMKNSAGKGAALEREEITSRPR